METQIQTTTVTPPLLAVATVLSKQHTEPETITPVLIHQAADGVVEEEPETVGRTVTHCTTSLLHQVQNLG